MRLLTLLPILALTLAPMALPAPAVASAMGVAVLDLQDILRDAKAAKSIRDQVQSKREEFQKQISADEERLRKRDKDLSEQKSLLSQDAFEQERKKFRDEVGKVQIEVQRKRVQLDRAYAKALSQVQNQIETIVKEMSKENGFAITFPASQTLFYAEPLDITAEVLKRLDSKLPSVKIVIEPISDEELMGKRDSD
jgi:Skp family chaperone for outer membrane proteins